MKKTGLTVAGILFCMVGIYAQESELERINSKKTEFSPSLSAEGDYLIFQSDKDASEFSEEAQWKLYSSHKGEDGQWEAPQEIPNINNNVSFVAGPSLSYDGNTLYFTAFIEGETETEDIYYSKRVGDEWGKPVSIGSPINTPELFEGFPSVSSDENSIYFIRVNEDNPWNKKNKENCFTIFVAHKGANGEWKEPKALPAPINQECENNPRIMADNKTLIFSSIRDGGQGSFDLYQSTLIGDNEWSKPIALDFINTKNSDLSPSIPASGDVVYYNASEDIVKAVVPDNFRQAVNITVHGTLRDKNKDTGIKGMVEVVNTETGEVTSTHHTNEGSGKYSLVLQSGNKYSLRFVAENYDPYVEAYDLSEVEAYEERSLDVSLEQFYKLDMEITDAEVAVAFPATIKIAKRDTKEDFQQLEVENNKATVSLPVGLSFEMVIKAKNYHNDTLIVDLQNDPANFREVKSIALQPKKVPVSIGLGDRGERSTRKVRIQNERTGEVIEADADQVLLLRSGDRYKVIVNSEKGYAFASDEIDLTNYDEEQEEKDKVYASTEPGVIVEEKPVIQLNIPITRLTRGTEITLKHILFETNSAELAESSFEELDQLVDMLNNNPELIIEISAHTDDVGSDAINLDLSQKRAQSVANYLLEKGVTTNRYQPKGYGESKPKVPNTSAANRAINRRVEFIVLQ